MDVDQVSGQCVELCCTDREDLVKQCMNNAFTKMGSGPMSPVPDDSNIFSYKDMFVDYASVIMQMDTPTKEIARIMVADVIGTYTQRSRNKRRIIFESDDDDEETPSRTTKTVSRKTAARKLFPERLLFPEKLLLPERLLLPEKLFPERLPSRGEPPRSPGVLVLPRLPPVEYATQGTRGPPGLPSALSRFMLKKKKTKKTKTRRKKRKKKTLLNQRY